MSPRLLGLVYWDDAITFKESPAREDMRGVVKYLSTVCSALDQISYMYDLDLVVPHARPELHNATHSEGI